MVESILGSQQSIPVLDNRIASYIGILSSIIEAEKNPLSKLRLYTLKGQLEQLHREGHRLRHIDRFNDIPSEGRVLAFFHGSEFEVYGVTLGNIVWGRERIERYPDNYETVVLIEETGIFKSNHRIVEPFFSDWSVYVVD